MDQEDEGPWPTEPAGDAEDEAEFNRAMELSWAELEAEQREEADLQKALALSEGSAKGTPSSASGASSSCGGMQDVPMPAGGEVGWKCARTDALQVGGLECGVGACRRCGGVILKDHTNRVTGKASQA